MPEVPPSLPSEFPTAPPGPTVPACRHILVVEDDPDAAETLRMFLGFFGHSVTVAHDGAEALEQARKTNPDVVLCDIGLPGGMDGYAVAQALRNLPGLQGAHLVAMTGYSRDEDRRRALAAGFDTHLAKPADPEALRRLVAG
jgi:CheY-like chemotaxis protein